MVKVKELALFTVLVIAFSPLALILMPLIGIAVVLGAIYLLVTKWHFNNAH
jgi:hypothetical protein